MIYFNDKYMMIYDMPLTYIGNRYTVNFEWNIKLAKHFNFQA